MTHYFCGVCGVPFLAVADRTSRTVRAEPQCQKQHPLCIQIGTLEEAEIKRRTYLATHGGTRERYRPEQAVRDNEIRTGCTIVALFLFVPALVAILMSDSHRIDMLEAKNVRLNTHMRDVERRTEDHQAAVGRRVDQLADSHRATVRPIGWDVPRDGGLR